MKLLSRLSAFMLVFAAAPSFADPGYSDMVVFGDSLSDPGNVFVLTGQVSVRPYDEGNIPSAPYPMGKGKTFSNGPTWSQLVAQTLKLQGGTGPALRNKRFTNYAFGGARAASSAGGPFDMSAQVSQYLSDNGAADPDALYAVWLGGNDVRDALVEFLGAYQATLLGGGTQTEAEAAGMAAAGAVIVDAVSTFSNNMVTLVFAGASEFVVPNVPNIGVAPAVTQLGPLASGLATQLSFAYNAALASALDGIELVFGVSITRVDIFTLISGVVASPGTFGFDNVEDACLTPLVTAGAICDSPDGYLFWDGIHPTRTGHELLTEAVLDALP